MEPLDVVVMGYHAAALSNEKVRGTYAEKLRGFFGERNEEQRQAYRDEILCLYTQLGDAVELVLPSDVIEGVKEEALASYAKKISGVVAGTAAGVALIDERAVIPLIFLLGYVALTGYRHHRKAQNIISSVRERPRQLLRENKEAVGEWIMQNRGLFEGFLG